MRLRTKVFMGVASVLVAVGAFFALNTQAMSPFRNCNDDAIIRCGALTQSELLKNYDNNTGDVQHIYAHYGISRADLAGDVKVGTVYQDGRVVVDSKTVATGAYSVSRIKYTSAGEPRPVTINGTTYYEGPSMAIFTGPVDAFVIFNKDGTFRKAVLSSCGNPLIATPKPPEIKPPVYACDLLTAIQVSDRTYKFEAKATAENGAKIVSYDFAFGDGKTQKVVTSATTATSSAHQYPDKNATYTAKVTVNFTYLNVAQPGKTCETPITIKQTPQTPKYSCDNLTPRIITTKEKTYEFTLDYTAEGGADLSKVVYNFGDGNSETFSKANASPVQHTFAKADTYKIVATLYFTVNNGTTTSEATKSCEATVKIVEKDMCPLPGKENYPKDSPECQPCPTNPSLPKDSPKCVPCPYNPELPKDSDKCVPPVTPPELPKTGLGDFIGGGLGLGSIIAAGNYWFASRKNLLSALLNK